MKIAIEAKFKNPYIYRAVKKYGTVKKVAELLKVSSTTVYAWGNLRRYPSRQAIEKNRKERYSQLEEKTVKFLGVFLEELFELRLNGSFQRTISIEKEVPQEFLEGDMPLSLPSPEEIFLKEAETQKSEERLEKVLLQLNPQHEKILKLRLIEGWSFRQIGEHFDLSRERVRQIYKKTLYEAKILKLREDYYANKATSPSKDSGKGAESSY